MNIKNEISTDFRDKNGALICQGDVINYLELAGTLYELSYTGTVEWSHKDMVFGVWEDCFEGGRFGKTFKELSALESVEVDFSFRDKSVFPDSKMKRP